MSNRLKAIITTGIFISILFPIFILTSYKSVLALMNDATNDLLFTYELVEAIESYNDAKASLNLDYLNNIEFSEVVSHRKLLSDEEYKFQTDLLPIGTSYQFPESSGTLLVTEELMQWRSESKVISYSDEIVSEPYKSITVEGIAEDSEYKSNLEEQFKEYLSFYFAEEANASELELYEIILEPENSKQSYRVDIGYATLRFTNCDVYAKTPILLELIDVSTIEFVLDDNVIDVVTEIDCASFDQKNLGFYAPSCGSSCSYARIDKAHFLLNSYVPNNLLDLSTVGYNGQLVDKVVPHFVELMNSAKESGFNPNLTSSYRSYSNQSETYEYWVTREMNLFGKDRATAERDANQYSAIPGFSEHQLGTTIDINAQECNSFDGFCQENENLWRWLRDNAHIYGFVQSYQKGQEAISGYVAEPWHYRWIGVDKAQEYILVRDQVPLNIWLDSQ